MNDADRKAAEQQYSVTAFDYASSPIGSRDWTLYWNGWQAACEWRDIQVVSKAEIDPCPSCKPNTVCRTPLCGRLKGKRQEPITPPAAQINQQLVGALERLINAYTVSHSPDTRADCWEQAKAALAATQMRGDS